jgi:CelD/BcsL family acetyltransferase involved in cellulose biosynthesis
MNSESANTRGMMEQSETCDCCVAASKGIHVDVFDNFNELASMQQEWDDFVESVGAEIFLTYDWCRVWWKYYGENRAMKIFVFRCRNRLVGIIPLFFEKVWMGPMYAKTVKIVGSDFTMPQFSLPIESDYMQEVAQRLFASISEYDWDIIHLGPIAGLYKNYDVLKNAFEESFGYSNLVLSENKGVQTYFKLADTWDAYLAGLNRKERTKIRRHYRLAHKAASDKTESIVANCATGDNLEEMFTGFVQMHQKHWQKLRKLGHFEDWPSAHEFHHELAEAQLRLNRLCLIKVTLGNWYLGYKYGYIFGNNYFDFLDARSDRKELANVGLGRIVYSEMIKKAIREKAKWIDSMRGKYKHKLEMGGKLFPTRNLYVVPKKTVTVVRVRLFRLFAWLLNLLYYRIWYNKVAPKLPLRRRALWKTWIRTCGLA